MGGTREANFSDCYQREHMNYRKTVCDERCDSDTNEAFRCFVERENVPQQ